jgi:hypothetical protein
MTCMRKLTVDTENAEKYSNAAFGTIQYSKIRLFVRLKNIIETRNTAFTQEICVIVCIEIRQMRY